MPLEATMIIIDNSENSRNGDYIPFRFQAQREAVTLLFSAKTQANPESAVGLMNMGGLGPEVLVTLTTDMGKILTALHNTKIKGESHLSTALQIAGLALKHRSNKSQEQRIIAFVCSPIAEDEKTLVKLAKKMKKNNIAVDFINFGEEEENTSKLEAFIANINSADNSHIVTVPASSNRLLDTLLSTPILGGDGAGAFGHGGGDGMDGGFDFGVDPSLDPELALALRMSLEEENQRKAREEEKLKAEKAAKEAAENLGTVKEEDENTPLLQDKGEGSSNGAGKKKKDDDEMDIA